jgi:hypothetical protein
MKWFSYFERAIAGFHSLTAPNQATVKLPLFFSAAAIFAYDEKAKL